MKTPNIVFILSDDQGPWGNALCRNPGALHAESR